MLDAINVYKNTKRSIKESQKRIERRIEKIEEDILIAMNKCEFKMEYGIEERFSEQIVEHFRDSGFDVEYTKSDMTLSVSWNFDNYPTNYFVHTENLKEYRKRLKIVNGKEFLDVFEVLDPILTRNILIEIRHLLKGRKNSFSIEELDDFDYTNVRKMLEMMGLVVNPKGMEFGNDYTIYKDIEVYIGAN